MLTNKKLLEKAEKELNTEFIPDLYDKAMEQLFDQKYYEAAENDKEIEAQKDIDLKILKDDFDKIGVDAGDEDDMVSLDEVKNLSDDEALVEKMAQKKQEKYEKLVAKSLKDQVDKAEADQGYETWFTCDECFKAINGGGLRFDCQICDNFSFCEKCYKKNQSHLHKFKKVKIPKSHGPPPNADELIAKSYMLCQGCRTSLLDMSKRVFICKECSPDPENGDAIYWCLKCKDSSDHEHKLEKFKGKVQEEEG